MSFADGGFFDYDKWKYDRYSYDKHLHCIDAAIIWAPMSHRFVTGPIWDVSHGHGRVELVSGADGSFASAQLSTINIEVARKLMDALILLQAAGLVREIQMSSHITGYTYELRQHDLSYTVEYDIPDYLVGAMKAGHMLMDRDLAVLALSRGSDYMRLIEELYQPDISGEDLMAMADMVTL